MLDNVVDINGLPLPEQREEIERKRRHGMGYLGLGSSMTMLGMKYGDPRSLEFTEQITKELALVGWRTGLELAKEKGPAPIMEEEFSVTGEMLAQRPEMAVDDWQIGDKIKGKLLHTKYSHYMQLLAQEDPALTQELSEVAAALPTTALSPPPALSPCHWPTTPVTASSRALPTTTPAISSVRARRARRRSTYSVLSYSPTARWSTKKTAPYSENEDEQLPDYFIAADDVTPKQHVDVQAAAQKWIDSSISKTANVPTDYPYEEFKDIYLYAYEQGLKGCTTFRFNPEAFQGVLVKEKDLENTTYKFTLDDGSEIEVKGNEEIEYDARCIPPPISSMH